MCNIDILVSFVVGLLTGGIAGMFAFSLVCYLILKSED